MRAMVLSSQLIDFLNEALVFFSVAIQIQVGFLLEVLKFVSGDVLPNSPDFLHDIKRRDIRMISDNLRPCLNRKGQQLDLFSKD